MVYLTVPNMDEGREISYALLEKKLVACANILPAHEAVYRWDDELIEHSERAVLFKTKAYLFDRVCREIRELHSYDCPCIVSWHLEKGYAPYFEWVAHEVL
jgi:periplasmic divalent cation tolerance protein